MLLEPAQRIAHDAPGDVLVADDARNQRRLRAGAAAGIDAAGMAEHRVLDELDDVLEGLVLVVVTVDVDDQHVVQLALVALPGGIDEELRGVELLDGHLVNVARWDIHRLSPYAPDHACHMPSSNSSTLTERSMAVDMIITAVGGIVRPLVNGGQRSPT